LRHGHKIKGRYGNFYFYNGHHDGKKIAVLIKKYVGNAVQRNYRKRIVRECIKKNLHILNKYNEVVFLFNYKGEINYQQLSEEFSNIFILK